MAAAEPFSIAIHPGDPRSISKQIADTVRKAISFGELAPGAQLPSVRGLAQQLMINPNTVAKAYGELAAGGWIEARQGLGQFVRGGREGISSEQQARGLDAAIARFINDVIALGIPFADAQARLGAEIEGLEQRKRA